MAVRSAVRVLSAIIGRHSPENNTNVYYLALLYYSDSIVALLVGTWVSIAHARGSCKSAFTSQDGQPQYRNTSPYIGPRV